jgi:hypothetical protein
MSRGILPQMWHLYQSAQPALVSDNLSGGTPFKSVLSLIFRALERSSYDLDFVFTHSPVGYGL